MWFVWRHRYVQVVNFVILCRVFFPVSNGIGSVEILQETWELWYKITRKLSCRIDDRGTK